MGVLMDDILQAWNFRAIQEFISISDHLAKHNKSVEDVRKFLNKKKDRIERSNTDVSMPYNGMKCASCGGVMTLSTVNTMPCNQVGGSWKSQWYCHNTVIDEETGKKIPCDTSIYNKESFQEVMKKIVAYDINKVEKGPENSIGCPNCGGKMSLRSVNTSADDRIGGIWQSQWCCDNMITDVSSGAKYPCETTINNEETAQEIVEKMMRVNRVRKVKRRRR